MKLSHVQRLSQLCATLLYNSYFLGFLNGTIYQGKLKIVPCPGLNCHSCPGALFVCPVGALQFFISYGRYYISLYVLGFITLIGAVGGRFVCGWACPFGLLQDVLYKLPVKKFRIPRSLEMFRYFILFGLIGIVVAITREPWFCKIICPAGTLEAGITLMLLNKDLQQMAGTIFTVKIVILLWFLGWMTCTKRPFCRTACPLGALYGLCNKLSIFKLRFRKSSCVYDAGCAKVCPVEHRMFADDPNAARCIRCLRCRSHCPEGAITVSRNADVRDTDQG